MSRESLINGEPFTSHYSSNQGYESIMHIIQNKISHQFTTLL